MNVIFLISRFLDGGLDTVLVEYVNAMVRYTHCNVTLAIGLDYQDAEVFLSRIDSKVRVRHIVSHPLLTLRKRLAHKNKKNAVVGIIDEVFANPLRICIMSSKLEQLASKNDVVIDFDSCHYSYVKAMRKKQKLLNTKFIAFSHFSLNQLMRQNERRTKRTIERWNYYDKIVTISDAMKAEALQMRPDMSEKIVRIYNALDRNAIMQKASEQPEDEAFNHPFILAVERLEESQKDLTTLIRAYALYSNRHKGALTPDLYIIGEGKSRTELEALIENLNMQEHIRLLGFISNPYPWIKKCIAMVHSSKFEGLPTVLIEGLLMGKVVTSSDCPTGPYEILKGGEAGILVPIGDVETFANSIEMSVHDEAKRMEITRNAQEHARQFSPEESIKQLMNII